MDYNENSLNIPEEESIYERNNRAREDASNLPSNSGQGLLGGAFKNMGKGGFRDLFKRIRNKSEDEQGQEGDGKSTAIQDDMDSYNFDPSDIEQVLAMQERLGVKVDGIFGPESEDAYRKMVGSQREAAGQDAYSYDSNTDSGTSNSNPNKSSLAEHTEGIGSEIGNVFSNLYGMAKKTIPKVSLNKGTKGYVPDYLEGKQGLVPDTLQNLWNGTGDDDDEGYLPSLDVDFRTDTTTNLGSKIYDGINGAPDYPEEVPMEEYMSRAKAKRDKKAKLLEEERLAAEAEASRRGDNANINFDSRHGGNYVSGPSTQGPLTKILQRRANGKDNYGF
tara:strand:- start:7339 stop:8337 length:999 start_codon:yes stop_codon:yes gene_type:complete